MAEQTFILSARLGTPLVRLDSSLIVTEFFVWFSFERSKECLVFEARPSLLPEGAAALLVVYEDDLFNWCW